MNPKISICIPAYKQADKLEKLLLSIEAQSFRDFEVIVTDDSPDNEVESICKLNYQFPLFYFRNSTSKGSPENWNEAISHAKGEWIKLIHHDDYFNSNSALQEFIDAAIEFPIVDYFFCATNILDSKTSAQFPYIVNPDHVNKISDYPAFLFHKNLIGAPSTGFFKRSINLRYDKKLIWLVDIEYYNRIIKACNIKFIDKQLITTVISEEQLTTGLKNNKEVEIKEFLYCYKKLSDGFDPVNRKIMRHRLLDLFKEFKVFSNKDLSELSLLSKTPLFATLFLFCCKFNVSLAFRVFYKINHFNIFR